MTLVKTILLAFAAILTTGFLISAFIIFFYFVSDSPDKTVNGNVMDNAAVINDAPVKVPRTNNSDLGFTPALVNNDVKQFFNKSEKVISITTLK